MKRNYKPEIELAFSLASWLKSSPIMSQGTGPKPREKKKMKALRHRRGRKPMLTAVGLWCSTSQK